MAVKKENWIAIPDSDLALGHDRYCWKVAKLKPNPKPTKKNPSDTLAVDITYHGTLAQACAELIERKVKGEPLKTLKEVRKAVIDAKAWIENELKIE